MPAHRRGISRGGAFAASVAIVVIAAACSDILLPIETLLSTEQLLILPQQGGTPAPTARTFWVSNSRQTIERLIHPDGSNTPYLELSFPTQSLASVGGAPLGATDSVLVTVAPRPAAYGFTISPAGLAFRSDVTPSATFFFGIYGDASVSSLSEKYANATQYVDALEIWSEVTVDLWEVAARSRPAGIDKVIASVATTGPYILAAPR